MAAASDPEAPHKTAPHRDSQTAADFIDQQLSLEHDARQVLPYKFDKCTAHLGPLRQEVFACLTCSPPPASAAQVYQPAGVCYACSISCHGEHTLVELFNRRNFACDCGTTRLPDTSPCTLRSDPETGSRGAHSQEPAKGNTYNHNFQNRFCACDEDYDAETEKGTMFQCVGLGTVDTGGCGEDWYHPECLMGLPRDWDKDAPKAPQPAPEGASPASDSHPPPPGFPNEADFDALVCYKCVESNPWIKRYANTPGFLAPVFRHNASAPAADPPSSPRPNLKRKASADHAALDSPPNLAKRAREGDTTSSPRPTATASLGVLPPGLAPATDPAITTATDPAITTTTTPPASAHATTESNQMLPNTGTKAAVDPQPATTTTTTEPKHSLLPSTPPEGTFSLFLKPDFREYLCHCPTCFPHLLPHPQLLDEEDTYEPSLSSNASNQSQSQSGSGGGGGGGGRAARGGSLRSHGSASLLERGEAALNNIDRVRAIEGVMVYNHLRDKVKAFLKPYAESGKVVMADDIKRYFEELRGDQPGIQEAGQKPVPAGAGPSAGGGGGRSDSNDQADGGGGGGGGGTADKRREQSGY